MNSNNQSGFDTKEKTGQEQEQAGSMTDPIFGDVIYAYTRAMAIDDGELVDVSSTAREAGIVYPVALSRAVWNTYVDREDAGAGQSQQGRLWDLLWMFRNAARKADGAQLLFRVYFALPDVGDWLANEALPESGSSLTRETHRLVTLKSIVGPGDDPAPVITIMLPDED